MNIVQRQSKNSTITAQIMDYDGALIVRQTLAGGDDIVFEFTKGDHLILNEKGWPLDVMSALEFEAAYSNGVAT